MHQMNETTSLKILKVYITICKLIIVKEYFLIFAINIRFTTNKYFQTPKTYYSIYVIVQEALKINIVLKNWGKLITTYQRFVYFYGLMY